MWWNIENDKQHFNAPEFFTMMMMMMITIVYFYSIYTC